MTFGTFKDGGDVNQANIAGQGNLAAQSLSGVANAGLAAVGSVGGVALGSQEGHQAIEQNASQANVGAGGSGGSDNTEANTAIGTF
jgi:hypothetical protein